MNPFQRLVLIVVMGGHHIGEEDVRALAAELQGDGNQVLRRVLHDQPAGGGLPGERNLADPVARRQWLTRFDTKSVDDVDHTRGQQVTDQRHQVQDRDRGLLGWLEDDGVTSRQCRGEFPDGHQDREVPRDDQADDAERLMEVVGHGVLIDLRQRPFLGTDRAGEVPEVIHRQRDIRIQRFPHRLAVVPRLGDRDGLEILLDAVGDLLQDHCAIRR